MSFNRTVKTGGFLSKAFPKCSCCGEARKGFNFGENVICDDCLPNVCWILFKKAYSCKSLISDDFTDGERSDIIRVLSTVNYKQVIEDALGKGEEIELPNRRLVVNAYLTKDMFHKAYNLAVTLATEKTLSDREKEAIGAECFNENISIHIVLTLRMIMEWFINSEGSHGNPYILIEQIVRYSLGWRIENLELSIFNMYDQRINYNSFDIKVDEEDFRILDIRGYRCAVGVTLTLDQYGSLWDSVIKWGSASDSELRRKAILDDLAIDNNVNPILLDTINCVCSGLQAGDFDPVNGENVRTILQFVFGWNISIEGVAQ